MELVTGHAGTDHISAADLASMYRGILTDDDVVLASGSKLSCTMTDANTCEIGTGDCFIQAHHCRVAVAEQLAVRSGSAGYNRNDLVVIRYTLGDGNVQDVYLAIKEGTATTSSSPSDPDLVTGDIDGGATMAEFALWRIPIRGINVETPVRIMPTVDTLQDQIDGKAAAVHNHSGQAITPASVAATGAVSGSSISDGVGTLAALRESVSLKSKTISVTTNTGGYVNLGLSLPNYVVAIKGGSNTGELNARCIPYCFNNNWYAMIIINGSPISYQTSGMTGNITVYYL